MNPLSSGGLRLCVMNIDQKEKDQVECLLCPRHCLISPGAFGFCKVRTNKRGQIVLAEPVKLSSITLDPVIKKPLRRFWPEMNILSIGFWGCNMLCPYCQNHNISHPDSITMDTYGKVHSPEEICQLAVDLKDKNNIGLAFTYNEPLTSFEYVLKTAKLIKEQGLKTVVVTNGNFSDWAIKELAPYIDAWNIDLKSINSEYYKSLLGDLETVKSNIEYLARISHVEITNLILTGENDSLEEMEALSSWLASIDQDIPLHISRSFPHWLRRDLTPPSLEKMISLVETAQKHLNYVYTGNF